MPSTTTDELRTWLSSDADVAAWPEQTTQLVHTDLLRTLQRQAMEADRVKVKVGEKVSVCPPPSPQWHAAATASVRWWLVVNCPRHTFGMTAQRRRSYRHHFAYSLEAAN